MLNASMLVIFALVLSTNHAITMLPIFTLMNLYYVCQAELIFFISLRIIHTFIFLFVTTRCFVYVLFLHLNSFCLSQIALICITMIMNAITGPVSENVRPIRPG